MALSLASQLIDDGGAILYTAAYQLMIDTHVGWLLHQPTTQRVSIDAEDSYKFEGDLTGLLLLYNVPVFAHYAVMRMNGMTDLTDMPGNLRSLMIPDPKVLARLQSVFDTTHTAFG